MTSLRAIWLLDEKGTVLLSRRYATVERRVRRRHQITSADNYLNYEQIAIPNDETFSNLFQQEFLDRFRHGSSPNYPVISLATNDASINLWPVVAIYRHGAFLVAIPEVDGFLVAKALSDRPPAVQLPGVTATFALLEDLTPFVQRAHETIFSTAALSTLQCHLCSIMPFGTPIETNIAIIDAAKNATHSRGTYPQKRPAWKPDVLSNMRQSLDINVKETVSAMIYGRQQKGDRNKESNDSSGSRPGRARVDRRTKNQMQTEENKNDTNNSENEQSEESEEADDMNEMFESSTVIQDVCHIHGTVECTSNLNGVPEVSLSISNHRDLQKQQHRRSGESSLKNSNIFPKIILVHECVLPPSTIASRQIIFSPPIGRFDLVRYSYRDDAQGGTTSNLPIRALYQVEPIASLFQKTSSNAQGIRHGQKYDLRLHLRWGMDVSRGGVSVKEFEVVLPFGGHIVHHTLTTTTGTLKTVDVLITSGVDEEDYEENEDGSGGNFNTSGSKQRRRGSRSEEGSNRGPVITVKSKLLWTPGSKFKHDGADAILTGTITMAPIAQPRAQPPEPLTAAPALVSGMCTGDRSPMPLSNQTEEMVRHMSRRKVEKVMREQRKEDGTTNNASKKKAVQINEDVEPVLQKRSPREDWKTWSGFAEEDLEVAEMGDVMLDGINCYAELNFRIVGYTLSGTNVDRYGIAVQPSTSASINTTVELVSNKYLIWNKFGESRHCNNV